MNWSLVQLDYLIHFGLIQIKVGSFLAWNEAAWDGYKADEEKLLGGNVCTRTHPGWSSALRLKRKKLEFITSSVSQVTLLYFISSFSFPSFLFSTLLFLFTSVLSFSSSLFFMSLHSSSLLSSPFPLLFSLLLFSPFLSSFILFFFFFFYSFFSLLFSTLSLLLSLSLPLLPARRSSLLLCHSHFNSQAPPRSLPPSADEFQLFMWLLRFNILHEEMLNAL